jgi:hypothetical protein
LCALVPPFDALNQIKLNERIKRGKYEPIPPQYSTSLHKMIAFVIYSFCALSLSIALVVTR